MFLDFILVNEVHAESQSVANGSDEKLTTSLHKQTLSLSHRHFSTLRRNLLVKSIEEIPEKQYFNCLVSIIFVDIFSE